MSQAVLHLFDPPERGGYVVRPAQDLLHVLARDHRRLDERCRSLLDEPDRRTVQSVAGLATDVLAHEASEQLLLHPLVTAHVSGGARLARRRTDEERTLERHLRTWLREDPTSPAFTARFAAFHRAFVEHTDREELEVFPRLRHVVSRTELRELGRAYATLAARLPTQLRYVAGGSEAIGDVKGRLLDRVRAAAGEILDELGPHALITLPDLETAGGSSAGPQSSSGLAGSA
jgi:hypothetical protein